MCQVRLFQSGLSCHIPQQTIALRRYLFEVGLSLSNAEQTDSGESSIRERNRDKRCEESGMRSEQAHCPGDDYLNMFSHHRLLSRLASTEIWTPNAGDNRRAVACNASETLVCGSG